RSAGACGRRRPRRRPRSSSVGDRRPAPDDRSHGVSRRAPAGAAAAGPGPSYDGPVSDDDLTADLAAARAELRAALAPFGLWVRGDRLPSDPAELADVAAELDASPYAAMWLGGSPGADLPRVRELLGGSERLVVG